MRRLPATGAGALIVALASGIFLQTAPATEAASSCTGWKSTVVPPSHINVLRTTLGRVDIVPFRRYVEFVLAAEWGPSNPREALAAGAVAIKQYAWYHALAGHWRGGSYGGTCYDVRDTNVDQVYRPATKTPTAKHRAAVERSWPVTLRKHSRSNPTGRFFMTSYNGGAAYRACGSGVTGWKLWQRGAADCAAEGHTFETILRTYYGPNLQVVTVGRHDLNGGGHGDVGVFREPGSLGLTEALIYRSTGRALQFLSAEALTVELSHASGWVTADLTGDRREDLVMLVGTAIGPQIRVFRASNSGFGPAEVWWEGSLQGTAEIPRHVRLVTADWDADGRADLGLVSPAAGPPGTSSLFEWRSTGTGLEAPVAAWEGDLDTKNARLFGGDFNGDGRGDLAAVEDRGPDGIALVVVPSVPTGSGFGAPADWYLETALAAAGVVPVEMDLNGDGRDDIVLLTRNGEAGLDIYLYRAGNSSFTKQTALSLTSGLAWASAKVEAADLNRDGLEDLFVLYDVGPRGGGSSFHALLSEGTSLSPAAWGGDPTLDWSAATSY